MWMVTLVTRASDSAGALFLEPLLQHNLLTHQKSSANPMTEHMTMTTMMAMLKPRADSQSTLLLIPSIP